jgi:hypothetical protein
MHRIFTKVSLAAAGAAVLTAAAAAPANGAGYAGTAEGSAAPVLYVEAAGLADCPAGSVCLWQHINFTGAMFGWREGTYEADFRTLSCPACKGGDFHDDASSWANNTRRKYCVSWGTKGGDPDNTMPSGKAGNFTPEWNDQASSIGFIGCP